jgi:hypothetical protein
VLEQEVEGAAGPLEVGDAITRTITVSVRNLPAMFIPPLIRDGEDLSGLRAYSRSPLSEDLPGREAGRTTGRRTESVTYPIEEPGNHTLPLVGLRWWNRRTGTIETAEAPAISLKVPLPEASPGTADGGDLDAVGGFGDRLIPFAMTASMLLASIALFAGPLRRRVRRLIL